MSSIVWTFGEPLVALVAEDRSHVEDGAVLKPYVAGAELNVAIGLRRLGIDVVYGAAVGFDPFGALVKKALRAEGLASTTVLEDKERYTGFLVKEWVGPTAEPTVHYQRTGSAASALPFGDWHQDIVVADWVHVSGITPMLSDQNRQALMDIWPACRGVRSVDLNLRLKLGSVAEWRTCLEGLIPDASLIVGSSGEFRRLWSCDPEGVRDALELRRNQVVIGTDGENGAWMDVGDGVHRAEAMPTVVVDPVGAGDGLVAGVIAARLWGWDWDRALRLGQINGASAVATRGDYEGYLYREQALAWVSGGWVNR